MYNDDVAIIHHHDPMCVAQTCISHYITYELDRHYLATVSGKLMPFAMGNHFSQMANQPTLSLHFSGQMIIVYITHLFVVLPFWDTLPQLN